MKKVWFILLMVSVLALTVASAQEPDILIGEGVVFEVGDKQYSIEDLIQAPPEGMSDNDIMAVFSGAIVGLVLSTYIPYFLVLRRHKGTGMSFDYVYLYNAFLSAVAASLVMLQGAPAGSPSWWLFVIALLSTSGTKKAGDDVYNHTKKKGAVQ